jgi:hypothetical protein
MRNANSQLPRSMILVGALHQPPAPHVSHAEIGAQGNGGKTVIARSPCDEAIQPFEDRRSGPLDCFAHRAARRAARWLAMTQTFASTQDGQRCALLTTKSRKTCTRATLFNSSG